MTCLAACLHEAPPSEGRASAVAGVAAGPLVACCHGILTNTTGISWCDEFETWAWEQNPVVQVLKREYWAWPVPALNVWVRNRILARALAREIYAYALKGAGPISLVGHSNGCDIALKTAHRLSALGVRIRSLVLLGAACEADVVRSGIFALVSGRGLDRAIAYSSRDDLALRSRLIWPFGRLGFTGWRLKDCGFAGARIFTRWYHGFGHGDYFSESNRAAIFDRIWRDCGLPYEVPAGGGR